jgi:hypothetical protein
MTTPNEDPHRTTRKGAAVDDPVSDQSEHTQRREIARGRTVDDHQPYQQRIDAVAGGEGHADRGNDRHRGGTEGTERHKNAAEQEHHPWQGGHPTADDPHRPLDEPVDCAVPLCDREQVGDADEDHEEIRRETVQHVAVVDAEHPDSDAESGN